MAGRTNTTGLRPTYYKINQAQGRIRLTDVRIPLGSSIFIARGWDRALNQGMKLTGINPHGNIKIANGQFSPEVGKKSSQNLAGELLGCVFSYDAQGRESTAPPQVTSLGSYKALNRLEHVQSVIEIVPSEKNSKKLTVVEARRDTQGLPEDRSKFVYTLTEGGARALENKIFDLRFIQDIRVSAEGVEVHYQPPGVAKPEPLRLPHYCFRDNTGKSLLRNKKAGMSSKGDFYESSFYTEETVRYRPDIDEFHGNLRLILHKVKTYEINRPADLTVPQGGSVKIFPSAADAAVEINGSWVPLTMAEPIRAKDINLIDTNLSQVEEGIIKSAIGPQTRFGESNNISSEYVRDPYFYGLVIFASQKTLEKWGENFAINRAKSIRAGRGIQSGRTHVMKFDLLFNEFADVFETNNPYFRKLSNFAEEIWGPGVSEDTQMEMAYWLKGVKMWVVKEMVALMAAEKKWGRYDTQNTKRYNYSEVLFNLSSFLSKLDVFEARFLGRKPVMFNWAEMSEITAGKTWYKYPFAKITELSAIPAYLFSMGHILFYPVDLAYFIGSWLFRTVASSINYCQHLVSMGYGKGGGLVTGLWKNPSTELTMLGGYWKGAISQFVKRNQYGTFMLTVGGTGQTIPNSYKYWVYSYAGMTAGSAAFAALMLVAGGLGSWLLLPIGLAALPSGISLLARGLGHHGGKKKAALIASGLVTLAASAALTITGFPVMAASMLSLAVIANVGFGIYSSGLLFKASREMKRATKEEEDPVYQKVFDKASITEQDLAWALPITKAELKLLDLSKGVWGWLRLRRTKKALQDLGLLDSCNRFKGFKVIMEEDSKTKIDVDKTKAEFDKEIKNHRHLRRLSNKEVDQLFFLLFERFQNITKVKKFLVERGYLADESKKPEKEDQAVEEDLKLQDGFTANRQVFDIHAELHPIISTLSLKDREKIFIFLSNHRSFRQEHQGTEENPGAYKKLEEVQAALSENLISMSYAELIKNKEKLELVLKTINVMTEKGKVIQGAEHPYRIISHKILDVYRAVEMALCIKACAELAANPRDRQAQEMLLKLIRESEEYMVTSTAMQTYRRLQLQM